MKKKVEKPPKEKVEEDPVKADEYECCGNLETDFPEVCALLGMKDIPAVNVQPETHGMPNNDETDSAGQCKETTWCPQPCLVVTLQSDGISCVCEVKIFGWKVDHIIAQALNKTLPSVSNLQKIHLWRASLTERTLMTLWDTMALCSNLRSLVLEGMCLPEHCFELLIKEDSQLSHVSLRNNRIGQRGARLIGDALSTAHTANKTLLCLNLAFNRIGDEGAKHIAQGLRLNRTLLCLSLAANNISDAGAVSLAEVLGPFALTHNEIVARRRLLSHRSSTVQPTLITDSSETLNMSVLSSTSIGRNRSKASKTNGKKKSLQSSVKKDEKENHLLTGGKKEGHRSSRKADTKGQHTSSVKSESKEDPLCQSAHEKKVVKEISQLSEPTVVSSTLLDPDVKLAGGDAILPGNTTLVSLNLAGNKLTEESLVAFLSTLSQQPDGAGLLRLYVNRNLFQQDCSTFCKLQELMAGRDPLNTLPQEGTAGQEA